MPRTLRLVDYNPEWPHRYTELATQLRAALGALVDHVEHVGSTSVPGLAGKPVIDLALSVRSEAAADGCIKPITALGFTYRGLNGDDERRRYYTMEVNGVRYAQLHLYIQPAAAWTAMLAFRDALRNDPALCEAYMAEKWRVAELVDWDKTRYSEEKGDFILRCLAANAQTVAHHHSDD